MLTAAGAPGDPISAPAQRDVTALLPQALQRGDQHAETGGVDDAEFAEVHLHLADTAVDKGEPQHHWRSAIRGMHLPDTVDVTSWSGPPAVPMSADDRFREGFGERATRA